MIAWLTDTFVYTGVLIALVLLLRRPVARHFGPLTAYALWALPALRFIMPPIVLPASFAPATTAEAVSATDVAMAGAPAEFTHAALVQVTAPTGVSAAESSSTLGEIALIVWLAGAAAFLIWRAWTYVEMRKELLAGARPVGEANKVRLVETPAVTAPVAFGVSDKVVALPMEFMARENRWARDLAIEHELAHHRGWDLLANILAQPVLALHWFNPLAWLGWRAMRRDQEAACDARVMARRQPQDRAIYGEVIASFAAGPRLALAAPMACPVLGEKSIVHRLRSLSRGEISPRRKMAGRLLLGGAALAVPLTASISYAAPQEPEMPAAPAPYVEAVTWRAPAPQVPAVPAIPETSAPSVARTAPLVAVPAAASEAPAVPRFPDAPLPPQPPQPPRAPQPPAPAYKVALTRSVQTTRQVSQASERTGARAMRINLSNGAGDEFNVRVALADALSVSAREAIPQITITCGSGAKRKVIRATPDTIDDKVSVCRKFALQSARDALQHTRDTLANDRSLTGEARDEVLESLDEQIAELGDEA